MKLFVCILTIVMFCTSCNTISEDEVSGIYISKRQINIIDTLKVLKSNKYVQTLYQKKDNKLLLINKGTWSYDGNKIVLHNLFPDEDEIYDAPLKNVKDMLITSALDINRKSGKLIIFHRVNSEESYMEKE